MRAYHENLDQKRKEKKRKEPSLWDYLYVTRMWSHEWLVILASTHIFTTILVDATFTMSNLSCKEHPQNAQEANNKALFFPI
jgi:hypothetical protein